MFMLLYPPGNVSIVALLLVRRCHVMVGVGMAYTTQVNVAVPPAATVIWLLGV